MGKGKQQAAAPANDVSNHENKQSKISSISRSTNFQNNSKFAIWKAVKCLKKYLRLELTPAPTQQKYSQGHRRRRFCCQTNPCEEKIFSSQK